MLFRDSLVLKLFVYEDGEELLQKGSAKKQDYERFDPRKLVTYRDQGNKTVVDKKKIIERLCKLSSGTFKIVVSPEPGNDNIEDRCGAAMTISVKITEPPWWALKKPDIYASEEGDVILQPYAFEGDCLYGNGLVTKSVSMSGKTRVIDVHQVNEWAMYEYQP